MGISEDVGAALVTGASRGIGRELTRRLASDGHDVVLVSRSERELHTLGSELEDRHGVTSTVVPADLSEPDAARTVYDAVAGEGITVHTLVNNAGFGVYGRFAETDLDAELGLVHLKVLTVTHLTKLYVREMVDRGRGRILNVASITGMAPVSTASVYSGVNHYLVGFSEALAEDLVDENVTVTTLCPGETDTGFMHGDMAESAFTEDEMMDPATVARAGYDGLRNGDRVVVPGVKNTLRIQLKRFLPRDTYVRLASDVWNE
jgi:short-subunit dehydrogenase